MPQTALKIVSPTSSAVSKSKSKPLPSAWEYLRPNLPTGWGHFFHPRRSGRYWGLAIICPLCEQRPGSEITPWNRWRWLAVHIASKHPQAKTESPAILIRSGRR